jgi:hypothetical protein
VSAQPDRDSLSSNALFDRDGALSLFSPLPLSSIVSLGSGS